ncbi:MAG: serine hydrolase [Candidatus Sumerlaeia bacterium]|nr:serine hydrolase [Candidatus Sumerlaeia bacterium]
MKAWCMRIVGVTCVVCWSVAQTVAGGAATQKDVYFPPPDSQGGWRILKTPDEIRRVAGMDVAKLDEAFAIAAASTKNGGLLVVRRGWLVYERYFGRGHREATPNLASCGKSFTSIAMGILMAERPDLFPDGLETKVFTPKYFPPEAFPLSDPAKAEIKLGQLLAFSAGIRGNNPCIVRGKETIIDPPGPDGWPAMVDEIALGKRDHQSGTQRFSAATLWCPPGGGYSYASSSIHLVSMIIRHVTGMELEEYVRKRLAEPMGWGRFTYAYRYAKELTHTPGGGGIAVRATDMLRFGYLLLNDGRWGDRQLVPAEYVRHCRSQSPYNPHFPYSLQFDVNTDGHYPEYPRDAFWKSGSGAHVLYVVPSLDLVVWKLAGRDSQYGESDTGVPLLEEAAKAGETRKDWKATVSEREGERRVLQKVIEAIVDGKSGPGGLENEKKKKRAEAAPTSSKSPANAGIPYLPGQIILHPDNRTCLAYNRDRDGDGRPDLCFICGPGGPEGFLYGDISDGLTQDQVLDEIIRHGGNSLYIMGIRSHGGDGKPDHNPFIGHDPSKGLDPKILDQWEKWFQRMEEHGIVIYFFFYDDGVKLWRGDDLEPQERAYIRGIVDRFEHHPNLIWCIAEEYKEALSPEKARKIAAEIRNADDHDHIIAVHQHSGIRFDFPDTPNIEQFAMQLSAESPAEVHALCRQAQGLAAGRFNVLMVELSTYHADLMIQGDRAGVRKVNWAAAMTGMGVMHLGTWEVSQGRKPPTAGMLQDYRHLQRFFESLRDLPEMKILDERVREGTAWMLGKPGHYIAYFPDGGRATFDLSDFSGTLAAQWVDPREGTSRTIAPVRAGSACVFQAPDSQDWLLHLAAADTAR